MNPSAEDNSIAQPLRGSYPDVVEAAIHLARRGDFRARRISIGPRSAIVTPQRRADGGVDAAGLAAQVYAVCIDAYSATGHYTDGIYTDLAGQPHILGDPTE